MSRHPLFERLSRSAPERLVVVTPTRRLARALGREFDAWQAERGERAWETPRILPYAAFISVLYELAQHDPDLSGIRAPLSAAQEAVLWEDAVEASDVALASTASAAALAGEAWALAHRWQIADRLRHYAMTEDTRLFAAWASDYQQRVEVLGAMDQARLPDVVRTLVDAGRLRAPAEVLLVGFDELTPQQTALFNALATAGCRCDHDERQNRAAAVRRIEATDDRDELERMADWVAHCLAKDPVARIGVVVPDLASRRVAVSRALDAVLEPGALLAPTDRLLPYSVSLGPPLAGQPLVATALRVLRLVADDIEFADASALLRSRYLQMGSAAARDRFDFEWRKRATRTVVLDHLVAVARQLGEASGASARAALEGLQAWRLRIGGAPRPWSEWTSLLTEALRVVGFPGAEPLDSREHQALIRWQELLAEFAALERVRGKAGPRAAVARLSRLASSTVFQPEGGDPPVQVLGVLEASGLEFDHLWIMGLTSDAWPPTTRAHPLLPLELQRARRMPGADVTTDLARAQSALDRLARSAPELIASHATQDGDRRVAASPMIAGWPSTAPMPRAPRAIDLLVPCPLEAVIDVKAPALSHFAVLQGGTSTLKDQAACAFRAFATHRLHADAPEYPHDGLDGAERGQLVHQVLAQFWQDLPQRTRSFLATLPVSDRRAALARASETSLARARQRRPGALSDALLILERSRLVDLASRWLQFEIDTRNDFEVIAIEERRAMRIGPLELNGRLDRVDRLAGGCAVVIDYKTGGGAGVRSWLGPRPDEPQLPLYLVTTQADACAVAFARVRAGDVRFVAMASDDGIVPGARQDWRHEHATWAALVDAWRDELTRLADDFAAGAAEVAPKRVQTCRNCGLGALCRLNERSGGLAVESDGNGQRDE